MTAGRQIALGLAINLTSWAIAWTGPDAARHHTFFPLWLGFIVAIDGVTRWRTGSSLISRLRLRFVWLFLISIPIWWLFEATNNRLENWSYDLPGSYTWLQYRAEASLAFSTVVPAIFVVAELVRSTGIKRSVHWIRLAPSSRQLACISIAGALLFAATMVWPDKLFPLIWISLFLTIDPIVQLLGGRSIGALVASGRWDTVLTLFAATLLCGFFWEFWNFWSLPKWTYDIEYADRLRVFEMPLLGYGGYLPFGLEVYALTALADRLLRLDLGSAYRFDRAASE